MVDEHKITQIKHNYVGLLVKISLVLFLHCIDKSVRDVFIFVVISYTSSHGICLGSWQRQSAQHSSSPGHWESPIHCAVIDSSAQSTTPIAAFIGHLPDFCAQPARQMTIYFIKSFVTYTTIMGGSNYHVVQLCSTKRDIVNLFRSVDAGVACPVFKGNDPWTLVHLWHTGTSIPVCLITHRWRAVVPCCCAVYFNWISACLAFQIILLNNFLIDSLPSSLCYLSSC